MGHYIVHCTLYIVYCILYIIYCILYIIYCILYIIYCIFYIVYCILYIVYYILYIVDIWCILLLTTSKPTINKFCDHDYDYDEVPRTASPSFQRRLREKQSLKTAISTLSLHLQE